MFPIHIKKKQHLDVILLFSKFFKYLISYNPHNDDKCSVLHLRLNICRKSFMIIILIPFSIIICNFRVISKFIAKAETQIKTSTDHQFCV